MKERWADLDNVIFSAIARYLDGRDVARCAATCRSWCVLVKKNHRATTLRDIHFIRLYHIEYLSETICPRPCAAPSLSHVAYMGNLCQELEIIGESWRFFCDHESEIVYAANDFYWPPHLDPVQYIKALQERIDKHAELLDWKLIEFPFMPYGNYVGFHRGHSIVLSLRNRKRRKLNGVSSSE